MEEEHLISLDYLQNLLHTTALLVVISCQFRRKEIWAQEHKLISVLIGFYVNNFI